MVGDLSSEEHIFAVILSKIYLGCSKQPAGNMKIV